MDNPDFGKEKFTHYIDFLLEWTKRINLVSGSVGKNQLDALIRESLLLGERITAPVVVDAGCGNGILGVPLALRYPEKSFFFVETTRKKVDFLQVLVRQLEMANVRVAGVSIQEFYQKEYVRNSSLVARGFPDNSFLCTLMQKKGIRELLLISSPQKIANLMKPLENFSKKQYNIPWRSQLVVFKMEKVSRETSRP